ncbi:MAG: protein translocase subunit SecF [Rhodospirillales bacterium]|nr:protein translocase subunit SecF [Rhodospirillales bacterium]
MFRGLRLVPPDTKIRFMAMHKVNFAISLAMIVASILLFAVKGLNYGIDFKGGILIEARTQGPADLSHMRSALENLELGEVSLQNFGRDDDVLIRIEKQEGGEAAQQAAVAKLREALGPGVSYERTEVVGPQVSSELFWQGMLALAAAIVAIVIYIWFRFEWQFGICAVIAEVHDIISAIGLFALLGLEFNLTSVAALLTIAGYSINDTVVVFDRVRENLRKYKTMPLRDLLDLSVNQTLSRTTLTSATALLALLALYFFGGEVLRGFSIAMIWGIVVGTYSSIFVASALLLYLNVRHIAAKDEVPATQTQTP